MHLQIDLRRQRLDLFRGEQPLFSCAISSAFAGSGSEPGSMKTPTGRFAIAEMIGSGEPEDAVFRSRQPTGEAGNPFSPDDQITTRILWLEGLDADNANTRDRYIYLHGTNHEDQLGLPASHGCIRLANAAVADLFALVDLKTQVSVDL